MVRSGCFAQQPLQERVIRAAELDEPHRGGDIEQRANEEQDTQRQTGRETSIGDTRQRRDQ